MFPIGIDRVVIHLMNGLLNWSMAMITWKNWAVHHQHVELLWSLSGPHSIEWVESLLKRDRCSIRVRIIFVFRRHSTRRWWIQRQTMTKEESKSDVNRRMIKEEWIVSSSYISCLSNNLMIASQLRCWRKNGKRQKIAHMILTWIYPFELESTDASSLFLLDHRRD